ncbi:transglutaminase family protein [Rivibacter subsaxonicus]|uniref:Transglutaminase-like putative cysteine protease n=1 Tax=Rivibacter subsaxonicus TaxID=457575 RepID=A0A4Q7VNW8_9BURK|nr:transglutaminase family protein [Rivibacter subsaxonicus]RZT97924.1 transglutaminase-like putative cysteine protease [Rivibacter subsaxonicus]
MSSAEATGYQARSAAVALPAAPVALIEVEHETVYRYESAVELAQHLAMLQPCEVPGLQRLLGFEMQIRPTPAYRQSGNDSFGNRRCWFQVAAPHTELLVQARSRIELCTQPQAPLPVLGWEAAAAIGHYRAGAAYDPAQEFCFASPLLPAPVLGDPALQAYALRSFWPGRPLVEAALELMHRLHADWRYRPASTTVATPVLEVFARREGVCQDFAHLMIAMLRSLGLATRYVSGYLASARSAGGMHGALVGAGASHAWLALALPQPDGGTSWLELDPTNDCIAAGEHVRLAHGRDYGDVAPLRGVIRGGGAHTPSVRVQTRRLQAAAAKLEP